MIGVDRHVYLRIKLFNRICSNYCSTRLIHVSKPYLETAGMAVDQAVVFIALH